MSNVNHDYIENYLLKLAPERTGIIEELEAYAEENDTPIITPDVAGLLALLIKTINAKAILEVGTAIGYSSIWMAQCAGEGTKIITIEKSEEMSELAKKNIKLAGFEERITVLTGDASEILKEITGSFDMIFVDAAKGQYMDFFRQSIDKLKLGGLYVCDNVLFRGMVAERKLLIRRKITIVKRLKKFLEYISKHESLQTSVLSMGDGVSISCKLKEVQFDE